jgi:glycosyltransferase involved in cell wall biosynthesis
MASGTVLDGGSANQSLSSTVAVVMPQFNAMPFLDAAIQSIVGQTKADFELCIYDDHSTDGSYECAKSWSMRDSRIRLARGKQRLGPVGSSNAAMAMTEADIVARMDADDVAHPDRLAQQYAVLCAYPDAALVGSTFRLINRTGKLLSTATADRCLMTDFPLCHPSIMVRRAAFVAAGGYQARTDYFEDMDLYARIAMHGRCLVIRQPLIDVRMAGQHSRLLDDRTTVVAQLDRLSRLSAASGIVSQRRSANAVKSIAQLHAYNLERPNLIGYMLKKGSFADIGSAMTALAFITMAQISPTITFSLIQAAWQRRERKASIALGDQTLFQWEPPTARTPARINVADTSRHFARDTHGDSPVLEK